MTIFEVMNDLEIHHRSFNFDFYSLKNYAFEKYKLIIPFNILESFFLRHFNLKSYFINFNHINLKQSFYKILILSNEEIFTKVDYGNFVKFKDESLVAFENLDRNNDILTFGTWNYPILVTKDNTKFITLDGNNRLRMLRSYLKFSSNLNLSCHEVICLCY